MQIFPEEFLTIILHYNDIFSKRVFAHVQLLLAGAILTVGKRTISSVLRTLGLSEVKNFGKYHRVLNRSNWDALKCSEILLRLLLGTLCSSKNFVVVLDETIERRWGSKISKRGIYRDSVRSSKSHFVKCSGLRWVCMMLVTPLPWAARVWALPFLSVLAPSEGYSQKMGKKHKKLTDWAAQMILQLHRWFPWSKIVVLGDGGYACLRLLDKVRPYVTMITSFRLDAAIYGDPVYKGVGRPPKKGEKLPKLQEVADDPKTHWQTLIISEWYGQFNKKMEICTNTALWYRSGEPVVPLRWVLLRDPEGKLRTKAILCTDLDLSQKEIVTQFVKRWAVEVTFEEVRKHLGVETQRQWSDKAIERTTPILMGLFSIVTLIANRLALKGELYVVTTSWYKKTYPTFSDALAAVRGLFWDKFIFQRSQYIGKRVYIPKDIFEHMQHILTYAT